jgi:flagellar biosynthesis anti-sigma factor FlgM
MRIQGPRDFDAQNKAAGKADQKAEAGKAEKAEAAFAQASKGASSGGAQVQISSEASRAARVNEESEKRFQSRVAELKSSIEAGTYKVDKGLLAEKIVQHECVGRGPAQ